MNLLNRQFLLPILLTLLALGGPARAADVWLLTPVNVVDPKTGEVLEDRALRVEGDRISAVMPVDEVDVVDAAGGTVIDGHGGWVIPGLAEMHAHVPARERGEQYTRDVLSLFLANGVTTIRGMLGQPWHLELRESLADGDREGPRLVTSGPSFNGNSVSSPEQGAAMVREQAAAGYDFLKIHPGLSRAEFRAIMAASREVDIPVAGHVSYETGLDAALEEGMATIDHLDAYAEAMVPEDSSMHGVAPEWFGLNLGAAMDPTRAPDLAARTSRSGVAVVPTQSLFETTAGDTPVKTLAARPGMDTLSPDLLEQWSGAVNRIGSQADPDARRRFLEARRALIAALDEAGATILLGSDAPQIMNVPGYSVHQELGYMVDAGLTPRAALRSGTTAVAAFFGFDDQGAVAPGKIADLVLLEANPLEDIAHTTAILGVARGGRWYDRTRLDAMLEDVRSRGL